MARGSAQPQRDTYHHGDLANALTEAATDLARRGGPDAVVLREAARHVGVSATAAYRHFAGHSDLIHAVKERAEVALAGHMRAELDAGAPAPDPRTEALRRLRALGQGYLRFALAEPGLFRTAFCRKDAEHFNPPTMSDTYQMLSAALDDLAQVGLLPAARRPRSEVAAWATVHGLAMLLLDGPLAAAPHDERDLMIAATLNTIIVGLCGAEPQRPASVTATGSP